MTWMLSLAVKSTVVLLLALVAATLLRRASASSRHAVWAVALAGLLILPVLERLLPRWEVALLPAAPPAPATMPALADLAPMSEPMPMGDADERVVLAPALSIPATVARPTVSPTSWWFASWISGVVLGIAYFAFGTLVIAIKVGRATRVTEDGWAALLREATARLRIRRRVQLRMSTAVTLPIVWGYLRPVVLLPPDVSQWSRERRLAFLLHELAHVARFDCFTQTIVYLVRALYWPHPLAWWAVSRLRHEAERACDDRVVDAGTEAPEYAQHLLDAARGLRGAPGIIMTASAVVERTHLGDRLLALLDDGLSRRALTARAIAMTAGTAVALVAVVAALQPVARAAVAEAIRTAVAPAASPTPAPTPAVAGVPAARVTPRAAVPPMVEGTVVGPDGRPIEKALVIVRREPLDRTATSDSVRTDAAGAFRLALRGGTSSCWVRVEASGLLAFTATGVKPGAPLRVALPKGLSIAGAIVDGKTRKPIADAVVMARDRSTYFPAPLGEPDAGTVIATTDVKGRYRLEGLAVGAQQLRATAPGYGVSESQASAGGADADFFLFEGASLSGVVTGPDSRPVAGATIAVESELPQSRPSAPAATDAKGLFRVIGMDAGTYRVFVRARGLAPKALSGIEVDDRGDRRLDVVLSRAYRLRGRLVDSEGVPVPGTVRVQEFDGVEVGRVLSSAFTDEAGEDGRFEIEGLPEGTHSVAAPVGISIETR